MFGLGKRQHSDLLSRPCDLLPTNPKHFADAPGAIWESPTFHNHECFIWIGPSHVGTSTSKPFNGGNPGTRVPDTGLAMLLPQAEAEIRVWCGVASSEGYQTYQPCFCKDAVPAMRGALIFIQTFFFPHVSMGCRGNETRNRRCTVYML